MVIVLIILRYDGRLRSSIPPPHNELLRGFPTRPCEAARGRRIKQDKLSKASGRFLMAIPRRHQFQRPPVIGHPHMAVGGVAS